MIPPISPVHLRSTHRMIAAKYSEGGSVLSSISENESMLADLAELDGATNDRLLGEEGLLPGISVHELVYGVRYASIVNAAFTHKNPAGSRFNDGTRGAWYAGVDRATSIAEVAYHRAQQLTNIDWKEEERSTYDDYLADFTTEFHDLRGENREGTARPFKKFLKPDPVPACYAESQQLARKLLASRSNGLIYPSVRNPGGTCIACFRPALVYHVRRDARLELRIQVEGDSVRTHTRKVPIPDE
ncbi:MAG: RES family NAD+ phosphorylase [Terriglobia bacterium]|nr:RES family NAD+ phosphorylase [Terriglobia bacterium]